MDAESPAGQREHCDSEPRGGPVWGVAVSTAEVDEGAERRGAAAAAAAQSGAHNLGGPRPFTSPHPACLFIASCSLKTHLLMFLGQRNLGNQSQANPPHTREPAGSSALQPSHPVQRGALGAPERLRSRKTATPGKPGPPGAPPRSGDTQGPGCWKTAAPLNMSPYGYEKHVHVEAVCTPGYF